MPLENQQPGNPVILIREIRLYHLGPSPDSYIQNSSLAAAHHRKARSAQPPARPQPSRPDDTIRASTRPTIALSTQFLNVVSYGKLNISILDKGLTQRRGNHQLSLPMSPKCPRSECRSAATRSPTMIAMSAPVHLEILGRFSKRRMRRRPDK